ERGRARLRDDQGEVLRVAEVGLGVHVDLPTLLQAVLRRLDRHLDGDRLAHLLAGLDRSQRFVLRGNSRAGEEEEERERAAAGHRLMPPGSQGVRRAEATHHSAVVKDMEPSDRMRAEIPEDRRASPPGWDRTSDRRLIRAGLYH